MPTENCTVACCLPYLCCLCLYSLMSFQICRRYSTCFLVVITFAEQNHFDTRP
ncbi:hypothetical protein CPB83DRAFT_847123 [Crepidotus variabilis]|uniref:Uncharacterized protein n=1 Tax=Crepidotus variabilis TaxID=179855 RepID=A0A9P6EPQ8_9AGAR|nr:hypothetical protein CPB83DRAFT_847123 [Crepidotus variabilis]